MPSTELHPPTSSGVTDAPVPRFLTNTQRRSQVQGTMSILKAPLDQPSKAKTKGTTTTDKDNEEEATEEASYPNVEAESLNFKRTFAQHINID